MTAAAVVLGVLFVLWCAFLCLTALAKLATSVIRGKH